MNLFFLLAFAPALTSGDSQFDPIPVITLPLPQGQTPKGPFETFNILGDDFVKAAQFKAINNILLDGLSFEWDYFMVHAEDPLTGKPLFEGMICVVLMDPRGRFENETAPHVQEFKRVLSASLGVDDAGAFMGGKMEVLPIGSNIVFVGKWAEDNGKIMERADFANFGRSDTNVSGCMMDDLVPEGRCSPSNTRTISAAKTTKDGDCKFGCSLGMEMGEGFVRITGETAQATWDLQVSQGWGDRPKIPSKIGRDWSKTIEPIITGEFFTVHMPWLRTDIQGVITRKFANGTVGQPLKLKNAHGYRENSWGQWAFTVDGGWDFAVFSSDKHDSQGRGNVQWAWQSYFHEKKGALDNLDVSWCEGDLDVVSGQCGNLTTVHFGPDDFTWSHPGQWTFDAVASQCRASDAFVVGEHAVEGGYRVTAHVDIGPSQTPILFPTVSTIAYVIYEWMPVVTGKVEQCHHKCDNDYCWCEWHHRAELDFEGTAGGELAVQKSKSFAKHLENPSLLPEKLDDASCTEWGRVKFGSILRPATIPFIV